MTSEGPKRAPRTVIVAVDFSPASAKAVRWAVEHLHLGETPNNATEKDRLILLHVLEPRPSGQVAELWHEYALSETQKRMSDAHPTQYDPSASEEAEQVKAAIESLIVEKVIKNHLENSELLSPFRQGRVKLDVAVVYGSEGDAVAKAVKDTKAEQVVVGRRALKGFEA